jgi:hypothetical protein
MHQEMTFSRLPVLTSPNDLAKVAGNTFSVPGTDLWVQGGWDAEVSLPKLPRPVKKK